MAQTLKLPPHVILPIAVEVKDKFAANSLWQTQCRQKVPRQKYLV